MEANTPIDKRERLSFLDFARGLCMLLVILDHVEMVDTASCKLYQMLDQIEVAGFFLISGYLYHDNGSLREWGESKIRSLIIPFLFFGLLYAIVVLILNPADVFNDWRTYLLYMYVTPVNYPMWFLRALFWIMLFQRIICKSSLLLQFVLVCCIVCVMIFFGYQLPTDGNTFIGLLLYYSSIMAAFASFPFFWIGQILKRYRVLFIPIQWRWTLFVDCLIIWILCARPGIHLHIPSAESWIDLYISALAGMMAILLFARDFAEVPFMNYLGRHSLIIFGTHAIMIYIFRSLGIRQPIFIAFSVLASMPFVICLLQRYFPWFVGMRRIHKK